MEDTVFDLMMELYKKLKEAKPEERSEMARRYAVTITEFEKVMAYFECFIMSPGLVDDNK